MLHGSNGICNWFRMILYISVVICFFPACMARDIIKLDAVNFELAVTSYPYVAILFYDKSEKSRRLEESWDKAASLLDDFYMDGEMGKINAADPELSEIVEAYRIRSPIIKVFRRGNIVDYRGKFDAQSISEYIKQDSQSSIKKLETLSDIRKVIQSRSGVTVFGLFHESQVSVQPDTEVYSVDNWGQFQGAADALRGHSDFYMITSPSLMKLFEVDEVAENSSPVIFILPLDSEEYLTYSGEIIENKIVDFVLKNAAPAMGELTFTTSSGEIFATQFFSSKSLKFILFLPPLSSTPAVQDADADDTSGQSYSKTLSIWTEISKKYHKRAIFSYIIGDTVNDVLDYFGVKLQRDVPLLVAHNPKRDSKYKSSPKIALTREALEAFVSGVIDGKISHVLKSEPVPRQQPKGTYVVRAVGSNVLSIVGDAEKDVLLEVFAPWCANCKALAPTYDILGKAFQGEDKIAIVKIDGVANDLPASWNVKSYPTLLWFPAKDKPYTSAAVPVPRQYWDAGLSLHELFSFVIRESSFNTKDLKVATSEQLGSLLSEEETLRAKYDLEEKHMKRNEGRVAFENYVLDYILGEIVYDGKRWHLAVAAGSGLLNIVLLGIYLYKSLSHNAASKHVGASLKQKNKKST